MTFSTLARLSPFITVSLASAGSLLTQDPRWVKFFFGVIFCELLSKILKRLIKEKRPSSRSECGVFPGYKGGQYGMPSGHAMLSGFTVFYWFRDKLFFFPIAFAIGLYVSYSRVKLNCHTYFQVFIGFIFGSILGITI